MGAKERKIIQESIREIGKADKYEIYTGKVLSVDEDNQACDVEIDKDVIMHDVRLSVAMGSDKAMYVLPKKDSYVIIGQMDGGVDYCLIQASEIDKVWIKIGDRTFEITKDAHVFDGGDNKGLVKVKELTDKLNTIEKDINNLKTALSSWTPVAQDGGAALKASTGSWFGQMLSNTQQKDIENDKVKH